MDLLNGIFKGQPLVLFNQPLVESWWKIKYEKGESTSVEGKAVGIYLQ